VGRWQAWVGVGVMVAVFGMSFTRVAREYGGVNRMLAVTDFRAFYSAGRMVLGGQTGRLYDLQSQWWWQNQLFGGGVMPFVNPPFSVLWMLVPASLSFLAGYIGWAAVNLGLAGTIGRRLYAKSKSRYLLAGWVAFFPVGVCLLQGQWSLWLVLAVMIGIDYINWGRDFWGGMSFALLLIKPQLLVIPLLVLMWRGKMRALGGMMVGILGLILVSLLVVGGDGMVKYTRLLSEVKNWSYTYTVDPTTMYSWRGWVENVLGFLGGQTRDILWVVGVGMVTGLMLWAMKRSKCGDEVFSTWGWTLMVLVMIFTSFHLGYHDLALLVIPAGLIMEAVERKKYQVGKRWMVLAGLAAILGWIVPIWGVILTILILETSRRMMAEARSKIVFGGDGGS
jgi:hypothetical protein